MCEISKAPPATPSRPPSIAEAATERPEDTIRRLEAELDRERARADKAEERCAAHARRLDAVEGEAATLVEALTQGPMPPPWWLIASRALDNLDRLAVKGVCFHEITPARP